MTAQDPAASRLDGDEIVYRRIPPALIKPGPLIASPNFKPREHRGERDVSVNRAALATPRELLDRLTDDTVSRLGPREAWRVASASVSDIRSLGLDVVPDPLPDDPGHALIRSAGNSLLAQTVQRQLAKLFRIVEGSAGPPPTSPATDTPA